jgi:hypothetical protein
MNEELTLAVEELRQRSLDIAWFIPVRLAECVIPDREIGGGTLRDLQTVDMFADWDRGILAIKNAIDPPVFTVVSGSQVVTSTSVPFEERLRRVVENWQSDGRRANWLVHGKAFFMVYSWSLSDQTGLAQTEEVSSYVEASLSLNGWKEWLGRTTPQTVTFVVLPHLSWVFVADSQRQALMASRDPSW